MTSKKKFSDSALYIAVGFIGSVASIIGLLSFCSPKPPTPQPKKSTLIEQSSKNSQGAVNINGNGNTVHSSQSFVNNSDIETRLAQEGKSLVVEDVIRQVYPHMQLDFRVRNPTSNSISVSRGLFKILKSETGPSPVGAQLVSGTAQIFMNSSLKEGDILQDPVALNVPPFESDRFVVKFGWSGTPTDSGHYYTAAPALLTSSGYLQCPLTRIHIQQQIGTAQRDPVSTSIPSWEVPAGEKNPDINWREEAKKAKPPF